MADTMWVNDRPLSDFKILSGTPRGFMGPPPVEDQRLAIPGRTGHLLVSRQATTEPRTFTVTCVLRASSAAEFRTLWDALQLHLSSDQLRVRFSRWPDREGYARLQAGTPGDTPHLRGQAFTLSFVMSDPLKYALEPDIYTLANGEEVALELGTAPSDVELQIISAQLANPVVYYKDARGLVQGEVGFSVSLAAAEWIHYNWDSYQTAILNQTGAGGEDIDSDIAPVGPHFFVAEPGDGDGVVGPSLLANNCSLLAIVRRAWL